MMWMRVKRVMSAGPATPPLAASSAGAQTGNSVSGNSRSATPPGQVPGHGEERRAADRQGAALIDAHPADQRRRLLELLEGAAHQREIHQAERCQLEAAMAPLEEAPPEPLLELADLMADRRGRQMQL